MICHMIPKNFLKPSPYPHKTQQRYKSVAHFYHISESLGKTGSASIPENWVFSEVEFFTVSDGIPEGRYQTVVDNGAAATLSRCQCTEGGGGGGGAAPVHATTLLPCPTPT